MLEPQERKLTALLNADSEKTAKILSALGHQQRLDILRVILSEPLNGSELVERLNMGTTGQLYHHLKALLGADLLVQEERGGRYTIPIGRVLPLLMLLAAVSDLMDTSDYIDMTNIRNNAGAYMGAGTEAGYNIHHLLMAVIENCILEHKAGYCSEVRIYLYDDGSLTVSDNGRGIPVNILPNSNKTIVQTVLTDMDRSNMDYLVPGGEKGVSIAVVNAMSQKLVIEIKKEGNVYRQEYMNGIPQTGLLVVGATKETGTSVTLKPNAELFHSRINKDTIQEKINQIETNYPGLNMVLEHWSVV